MNLRAGGSFRWVALAAVIALIGVRAAVAAYPDSNVDQFTGYLLQYGSK
jgi:hypothetical protein